MSLRAQVEFPVRLPGLNNVEYFVFSHLKSRIVKATPNNLQEFVELFISIFKPSYHFV